MPKIVVYAVESRTREHKKALMQKITVAEEGTFNVQPDRIGVQMVESKADNKTRGGVPYSER